MDNTAQQKVIQYLNEAHAMEVGLISALSSQIAMTPRGTYRTALDTHLRETREHASAVQKRLGELGDGRGIPQVVVGIAQSLVAQGLALGKTPIDLLRGSGGEEKLLKNAKDACATESLEIATYAALEHAAHAVGDEQTAKLARKIRSDEERMLERLMRELPKLTRRVIAADVDGEHSYELSETGAADAVRSVAGELRSDAKAAAGGAKRTARKARKVPGVARAKGAVAGADDLTIARYDKLTADEITSKLPALSQIELAKVGAYERKNDNRTTILSRISALQAKEPWPGYDEQTADDIRTALAGGNDALTKRVREYERAHKARNGVLEATERELTHV